MYREGESATAAAAAKRLAILNESIFERRDGNTRPQGWFFFFFASLLRPVGPDGVCTYNASTHLHTEGLHR